MLRVACVAMRCHLITSGVQYSIYLFVQNAIARRTRKMIWKVKAVEATPVEGDETEYEFQAPTTSMQGGIQILDFTPEMEMPVDDDRGGINWEKQPAIVVYAYPDR